MARDDAVHPQPWEYDRKAPTKRNHGKMIGKLQRSAWEKESCQRAPQKKKAPTEHLRERKAPAERLKRKTPTEHLKEERKAPSKRLKEGKLQRSA
jgi:hypothetical protein